MGLAMLEASFCNSINLETNECKPTSLFLDFLDAVAEAEGTAPAFSVYFPPFSPIGQVGPETVGTLTMGARDSKFEAASGPSAVVVPTADELPEIQTLFDDEVAAPTGGAERALIVLIACSMRRCCRRSC